MFRKGIKYNADKGNEGAEVSEQKEANTEVKENTTTSKKVVPLENLREQEAKFKNQIAELQNKVSSYEADKQKEEEAKLLEEKNYKELLEKKELEIERLREETETTKKQVIENMITQEIKSSAIQAGAVDPDTVMQIFDRSKVSVEDGKVTGVSELMDVMKQEKSFLFGSTTPANKDLNSKPASLMQKEATISAIPFSSGDNDALAILRSKR